MIIDTFSANSLKILDKSKEEFLDKYVYNLVLYKKDKRASLGEKFHNLIRFYLKGYDTDKMMLELNEEEKEIFLKVKKSLEKKKKNFIHTEYSFNIKEKLKDKFYYLTGRFDAVYKEKDCFIVYDWKTLNIPKDAINDLQSVVYLYAMNKIFKTEKIKMRYMSLTDLNYEDVTFKNSESYKNIIDKIVLKIYN